MRPITQHTILKELERIYQHAFKNQKWHVALRALEQHAYYTTLLKKHSIPPQRASKKQDHGLTHPPPSA